MFGILFLGVVRSMISLGFFCKAQNLCIVYVREYITCINHAAFGRTDAYILLRKQKIGVENVMHIIDKYCSVFLLNSGDKLNAWNLDYSRILC